VREDKDQDLMTYVKVLLTLSFRMNCKKSKQFRSDNADMIMATVNDTFPEWKFDIENSSKKFNLFSIGYKIIDDIDGVKIEDQIKELEIKMGGNTGVFTDVVRVEKIKMD